MEEVKTCTKCGTAKLLSGFAKDNSKNKGYKSICKDCNNIAVRKWRDDNRDYRLEYDRKYRESNKDKIKIKNQKRYNNLTLDKKFEQLVLTAAKRKNISCSVTVEDLHDVWQKQNGLCAYTKLPLTSQAHQLNTVSLDRIDSDKDYTVDNIQLVCVPINRMKLDMTEDQFIKFCQLVAQNSGVQTPDCTSP